MIKKRSLFLYFLFTYLIAWFFWTIPIFLSVGVYKSESLRSLFGLGVLAPIVVATVMSTKIFGRNGIRSLIDRFHVKGVLIRWYLVAAFTFVGISIAMLLIYFLLEEKPTESIFQTYSLGNYFSMLPVFIVFATLEEVGWRGFALPELRKTLSPLPASILLGLIWAVWHVPKLISEGTTDVSSFIVMVAFGVLLSLFLTWVYENSNGSVTLAILAHAAFNSSIFAIDTEVLTKIGYNKPSIIYLILLFALIALIVSYSGTTLKRQRR